MVEGLEAFPGRPAGLGRGRGEASTPYPTCLCVFMCASRAIWPCPPALGTLMALVCWYWIGGRWLVFVPLWGRRWSGPRS